MRNFTLHFALLLFSICCYGQTNYPNTTANVYIAGSFMDGTEEKACYWQNGRLIPLADEYSAEAIAVENGNVYVAGYHWGGKKPCYLYYYVNGRKTVVKGDRQYLMVRDMAVCNGKIYITGNTSADYSDETWVTWIDGIKNNGGGRAVTAYDGVIYAINANRGTNQDEFSAYGQRSRLEGMANGITVAYGIVYVAGYYTANRPNGRGYYYTPCYWLDGTKKSLPMPNGSESASLDGIAVLSNGHVHAIGSRRAGNGNFPIYWVENTWRFIPDAASFKKIYAFEDKIYILGTCKRGTFWIPCYWVITENSTGGINIEKMVTLSSAKSANDIVVTKD
mgnify:CR=1 FL=1